MSEYKFCKTCKDFHYTNKECPPVHYVFHPDYLGEEGKAIHGNSHYDAALKYAEYYNSNCDYSLMNDTVEITVVRNDVKKIFKISAEQSIDYSADEVEMSDSNGI